MAELPTGTVTFLFTDIEGSTRLLRELGDRYATVLKEHQLIIRQAIANAGGAEVGIEGDSFFAAFSSAPAAVGAAVAAQLGLAAHGWVSATPDPRRQTKQLATPVDLIRRTGRPDC